MLLISLYTTFVDEGPIKHQIHPRSRVDEDRIVGGIPAGMTEFPYMVSLTKSTHWLISFHHFCGGAILSSTRVLTAAQCTYGTQTDSLRVEVGKYYLHNNLPGHEAVVGVDKA